MKSIIILLHTDENMLLVSTVSHNDAIPSDQTHTHTQTLSHTHSQFWVKYEETEAIKKKLRFLLNTNLHQDYLSLNISLWSVHPIFGILSCSRSLSHTEHSAARFSYLSHNTLSLPSLQDSVFSSPWYKPFNKALSSVLRFIHATKHSLWVSYAIQPLTLSGKSNTWRKTDLSANYSRKGQAVISVWVSGNKKKEKIKDGNMPGKVEEVKMRRREERHEGGGGGAIIFK